jgi:serine protease AprX
VLNNVALNILAIIILLMGLVPSASVKSLQATPHLQPELAALAAHLPNQTISVIVQKSAPDHRAETETVRLGGTVTRDLWLINAFAAEIQASRLPTLSQVPGVKWISLNAPVKQSDTGSPAVFITWATQPGVTVANTFASADAMADSPLGPNGTFASGANAKGALAGFDSEITPGYAISKVEVALQLYTPVVGTGGQDPILSVAVAGKLGKPTTLNHDKFKNFVGASQAGVVYVDVTSTRNWQWSDFNNGLEVVIDQSKFKPSQVVNYDAVGLRVTSQPGSDASGDLAPTSLPKAAISLGNLASVYNSVIRATSVWNEAPAYLQGQGMTIAVVDSGVVRNRDLGGRVIKKANFDPDFHDGTDKYGHGTFVSWIIGGDGHDSDGQYIGVAPKTNLVSVRVSDDEGMANEADVVSGLQWVYQNKSKYNIRVANLSLNSSVPESYQTSPMDAAVEVLWFNGIVVVTSAGNNGSADLYAPANDPFVITVGATDDHGTAGLDDDSVASFSAWGLTEAGTAKPELVAPGRNIIALLPDNGHLTLGRYHLANQLDSNYFRMSGTSVSAPMVAGVTALLLQDEPTLTPDQVKYRLMATANKNWPGYDPARAGAGYVDAYAAVHGSTTESANTGLPISRLLTTGINGISASSVSWSSVSWSSVSWSSVSWSSVSWSSVSWSSDYWEP